MNQEEAYKALTGGGLSGKSARRILVALGKDQKTYTEDNIRDACEKLGFREGKTATACAPFASKAAKSEVSTKRSRPTHTASDENLED